MKRKLVGLVCLLLICALWGCEDKSGKYDEAMALYEAGNQEEAYALFSALGSYKDAQKFAGNAKRAIDYQAAIALRDAGEYQQLLDMLEADALQMLQQVKDPMLAECRRGVMGDRLTALSLEGNLLTFVYEVGSEWAEPRLVLEFSAKNDIYTGISVLSAPADLETFNQEHPLLPIKVGDKPLFRLEDYRTQSGYALEGVDLTKVYFTIPTSAAFFETDIFEESTGTFLLPNLSFSLGIATSGKEGYFPKKAIAAIQYNDFPRVFSGGTLTLQFYDGETMVLERTVQLPE